MKLKKILDIFCLEYVVIYFDTDEEGADPQFEGWSSEVPYWLGDCKVDEDCHVFHDPENEHPNKKYGLVLIVKEPI